MCFTEISHSHTHILAGIIFVYTVVQLNVWFAVHSTFLFWSVRFPFSYRSLRMSGRLRHAHIIIVIVGIVLPFPAPLVLLLVDGYFIPENPTLYVIGRNADVYFFMFTLVSSILVCIMVVMLILIFWTILKVIIQEIAGW